MRIINDMKPIIKHYGSLSAGKLFIKNNCVCIKTNVSINENIIAINLESGERFYVGDIDKVNLVNGELYISQFK